MLKISWFYTYVQKTTIIWCTVAKIQSETNLVLSFWVNFCPLHSFLLSPPNLTTQTTKIWKNEKTMWRCHYFELVYKKDTIKWCIHTQIWSAIDIMFCCFRSFFALLPHYWSQKLKFWKNLKDTWRYYSFTHAHHESRSYDVCFHEI